MVFRRVFLGWLLPAAVGLPIWLFVARGVVGATLGWDVLLFLVVAPVLGVFMLLVAGLTWARVTVRVERAASWTDVAVQGAWHLAIAAFCVWGTIWIGIIVIVLGLAAFWVVLWQLISDTGRRVHTAVRDFSVEFAAVRDETRRGAPIPIGELAVVDEPEASGPGKTVAE